MMTTAHCHLVECFSRGVGVATGSLQANFLWVEARGEVRDIEHFSSRCTNWRRLDPKCGGAVTTGSMFIIQLKDTPRPGRRCQTTCTSKGSNAHKEGPTPCLGWGLGLTKIHM